MKTQQKAHQSNKSKKFFFVFLLLILIITIAVIVLTKGGRDIISEVKISMAKSLTLNSPVLTISDLVIWYEPVLETSVDKTQTINNAKVITWYNNAPSKNDGNATMAGPSPTYLKSAINHLPAIHFNAGQTLAFHSLAFNQKYYTFFIVEKRASNSGNMISLGNNIFNYSSNNRLGNITSGYTNISDYNTPRISTFILDANGGNVFDNGKVGTNQGIKGLLNSSDFGFIGGSGYVGDIAEIILYNRALNADERNIVQKYISKKYSIKISISS